MSPEVVQGLALGIGLAVANSVLSLVLYQLGRRRSERTFYRIVLTGLLVRMAGVLVIVTLVVGWFSVDVSAFIGSLLVTFVVGMAVEIFVMHKNPAGDNS